MNELNQFHAEIPPRSSYQPLSWILCAAILGIGTDRFFLPPSWFWLFGLVVALIVFVGGKSRPVCVVASTLLVTFIVFGFWHHSYWNTFSHSDIARFAEFAAKPAAIRGTIYTTPQIVPAPPPDHSRLFSQIDRTTFSLRTTELRDDAFWVPAAGQIAVSIDAQLPHLRKGDRIELIGLLSKPIPPQNPDDFNYPDFLRSRRILSLFRASENGVSVMQKNTSPVISKNECPKWRGGSDVSIDENCVTNVVPNKSSSFWGFFDLTHSIPSGIESIRLTARSNLQYRMTPETAPLAAAMLLGMREGVDEDTRRNLLETGTTHILAISGLHIGLVAAAIGLFLSFCGMSNRKMSVILITTVIFYLFLTDMRPPAIRATVLVCIVSLAIFTNRRALGINTLCATALVVLAINPTELFQFGAQMSFIATGAFFWIPRFTPFSLYPSRLDSIEDEEINQTSLPSKTIIANWKKSRKMAKSSTNSNKTTLTTDCNRREPYKSHNLFVQFGVWTLNKMVLLFLISATIWAISLPLILERFHIFAPISLIVNPLIWLPLAVAIIFGLLTMIFGGIPFLGVLCGWCASAAFAFLFGLIGWFHQLCTPYWIPGPPIWWLLGFYGVFAFFTFLPIRSPSRFALAALFVFWVLVGLGFFAYSIEERRWNDRLTLSFFAVGHGNATLITTPDSKTILCDVGSLSSPENAAEVVSQKLWRLGKNHIDILLLSHADSDHYNGVPLLLERFSIGAIIVSSYMFDALNPHEQHFSEQSAISSQEVQQLTQQSTLESAQNEKTMQSQKSLQKLYDLILAHSIPIIFVGAGDSLESFGFPRSLVLHPPKTGFEESHLTNASSLVVRLEHRGVGILLTGDLDSSSPPQFLLQKAMPTSFLLVPHHGGRAKQMDHLLDWATPDELIISAGKFTHRDEVLENYRNRGFQVRSTFCDGYIEVMIDRQKNNDSPD
ncbi:MAG: ComEC/Rec2 family competence protein [Thermoguttaceae bacterium]